MKKGIIQWATYVWLAAALGCSSGGGSAPAPASGPASATAPVEAAPAAATAVSTTFSAAQVDRGESVFDGVCSACHSVSELRGNTFLYSWRRRTAWDLYSQVVETMPEDAPGSLKDQEYVDVVAYILRQNGHRPGDGELAPTEASLGQLPVDASEIGTDGSLGGAGA